MYYIKKLSGSLQTGVLASIVAPELPGKDLPASDGAQRAAGLYRARSGLLDQAADFRHVDHPASAARIPADGRPGVDRGAGRPGPDLPASDGTQPAAGTYELAAASWRE